MGLLFTTLFVLYGALGYASNATPGLVETLKVSVSGFLSDAGLLPVASVFIGCFVLFSVYYAFPSTFSAFVFNHRVLLAVTLLFVLVICNVSGSSIGQWAAYLPDGSNDGLLLGRSREMRTDEFALFTGMTFAQFNDPSGFLPYYGEVLRGVTTDMFIEYGQPVADLAVVFRPFQWGYLVLGLERGLSFFWYGRLIALFMVSFEFGRLLTGDKRWLSLGYAFLVALSPVVSWWFSINGLVEMLVFSQGLLLIVRRYLMPGPLVLKAGLMVLAVICAGGFALAMYPAWEIPLLYVLVAFAIAVVIEQKGRFPLGGAEKVLIATGIFILAALLGYVFLKSQDAISAFLNTAYPGSRINAGGGVAPLAFRWPMALFLPFVSGNAVSTLATQSVDNCTAFFDLFPLGILLALYVMVKRRDIYLVVLLTLAAFFGLYCFVGFPEWLAEVTLMGKSLPERAYVVFSLVNVMLFVRAIALVERRASLRIPAIVVGLVLAVIVTAGCYAYEHEFLTATRILTVFAVVALLYVVVAMRSEKSITFALSVVSIVCGLMVNPVQQGISIVSDNSLVAAMQEVKENDPEATWLVALDWRSNISLFAGVKNLSSTNIYPNLDLWDVLDSDGSQEEIWNRYAHLHVSLTEEETSFELSQVDLIDIDLSLNDLDELGVTYVVTETDLGQILAEDVSFIELEQCGTTRIYQVLAT